MSNEPKDVIVVGGGHASADFIPDLCDALGNRVRGVVFIDHDSEEIRDLRGKLQSADVRMLDIKLQKRVLEREQFNDLVQQLDMENNTAWSDDLPNHPPMIRVQIALRSKEIFDAVWSLLPVVGGRLTEPQCKIIFAFGMTGMTSSTVAIEAGVIIRRELTNRILNLRQGDDSGSTEDESTIDSVPPIHIGIGLFPPDPLEGAGEYNLLHGLNVSGVIQEKLPTADTRVNDMQGHPFNRFLFIDASGFSRTQNLKDFDIWSSRTASTLLTCRAVTGDTFYDANELIDTLPPYSNAALILAGVGPDDQDAVSWLRDIVPKFKHELKSEGGNPPTQVQDENIRAFLSKAPAVVNELEIGATFNGAQQAFKDANDDLVKSRDELAKIQSTVPEVGRTPWIVGLLGGGLLGAGAGIFLEHYAGFTLMFPVLLLGISITIGGLIGGILGFTSGKSRAGSKHKRLIDESRKSVDRHGDRLNERLRELFEAVQACIEQLQQNWRSREFSHLWFMPQSADKWVKQFDNPSLPVQRDDRFDTEALHAERSYLNDILQRALRYTINPIANLNLRVGKGRALIVGSPTARDDFALPQKGLETAFSGSWDITYGEGNLSEAVPVHYLLFWVPDDGKIAPRYYKERTNIKLEQLPARFNAWPNRDRNANDRNVKDLNS